MNVSDALSVGPGVELIEGRYRLERLVGIGGMASVWEGRDQRLDRQVAVKVLSDALAADPDFVARFRREAQTAARLSHPNLVKVFDYEPEGRPCLVMEYVEGGTLDDTANRPGRAVEIEALALQLLSALAHIHGAGIVHRDVKPANVLIGRDGRAMLTDFGIAQPEDATRITQTGQVIGTLAYMAPELHEGERATPRSDLYSCGVLLREYLRDGSPALRTLVERLTEHDPDLRPRSAKNALAYLAGEAAVSVDVQHAAVTTTHEQAPGPPATEEPAAKPGPAVEPEPERVLELAPAGKAGRERPAGREYVIRGRHLAAALLALGAIVVAIVIATSVGGDGEPEPTAAGGGSTPGAGESPEAQGEAPSDASASADAIPAPKPNADPAEGAGLEQDAYTLLQSGDSAGAIEKYEKALAQFPEEARAPEAFDQYPNYAYALYSYADALIQEGRPEEAIPVLEERLNFPDQQETVQALLDEAEATASE